MGDGQSTPGVTRAEGAVLRDEVPLSCASVCSNSSPPDSELQSDVN